MTGLTTARVAELAGMSAPTFRRAMQRERKRGQDYRLPSESWPDARTPLWDEASIRAWLAGRPGGRAGFGGSG